jgi:hypothetical protein
MPGHPTDDNAKDDREIYSKWQASKDRQMHVEPQFNVESILKQRGDYGSTPLAQASIDRVESALNVPREEEEPTALSSQRLLTIFLDNLNSDSTIDQAKALASYAAAKARRTYFQVIELHCMTEEVPGVRYDKPIVSQLAFAMLHQLLRWQQVDVESESAMANQTLSQTTENVVKVLKKALKTSDVVLVIANVEALIEASENFKFLLGTLVSLDPGPRPYHRLKIIITCGHQSGAEGIDPVFQSDVFGFWSIEESPPTVCPPVPPGQVVMNGDS